MAQLSQSSPIRIIACSATALLGVPALAVDVLVANPGFENITGETVFNEFTFGPPPGWDLWDPGNVTDGGDGPIYYIGTLTPFEPDPIGMPGVYVNFPDGASEGIRVGIAFNFAGSGGTGEYGFEQTLNETLAPNTTYVLEVGIGNIATGTAMSGQKFVLDGFPGYRVELLAGGVLLVQDENSLRGSIPEGEFATSSVTYTTGAAHPQLGAPLSIRLVNLNEIDPAFPGSHLEVDFDDVRLTATLACPDLDSSGAADFGDLLLVLGSWGPCADCAPDLDGDGVVGFADLLLLLSSWGPCT